MIDGLDQKKMYLPHLRRLPKDVKDECLVQMHLVGCLAYNGVDLNTKLGSARKGSRNNLALTTMRVFLW